MKILYACAKYDYGDPNRGLGYEYYNFLGTFQKMGLNIIEFDCMSFLHRFGKKKMNQMLWDTVLKEKPDLMMTVLMRDEFDFKTIYKISHETNTTTYNWFADDHWRYDNFSRHWAKAFNWVSTTDAEAVEKYHRDGYSNVIKTQWGFNPDVYVKKDLPYKYDVTFVGQVHSNRKKIVSQLKKEGINIECFGAGWPNGRVTQEEMVNIFNQSKINLNLTNSSVNKWYRFWKTDRDQIKGRNFEVPGAGGFILTSHADNLEQYFDLNNEIATYDSFGDLKNKILYYIKSNVERDAIKTKGYMKCLSKHTYEMRFRQIISDISNKS